MVALTGKTRLRLPFDLLPGALYLRSSASSLNRKSPVGPTAGRTSSWQCVAALPVRGGSQMKLGKTGALHLAGVPPRQSRQSSPSGMRPSSSINPCKEASGRFTGTAQTVSVG